MMANPLLDFECLQTITTCEDLSNKTFKLWKHSNNRLILVRQANGDCNSESRHYFCYSTARNTQLLVSNLNGKQVHNMDSDPNYAPLSHQMLFNRMNTILTVLLSVRYPLDLSLSSELQYKSNK